MNRSPDEAHGGRPIRDEGTTTIGWCWWDGPEVLCATDDRWGVRTEHRGDTWTAIEDAVHSVRTRTRGETKVCAVLLAKAVPLVREQIRLTVDLAKPGITKARALEITLRAQELGRKSDALLEEIEREKARAADQAGRRSLAVVGEFVTE